MTGATGFLGAHTAAALIAAGHDAVCLVRPKSDRAHLDAIGATQVPGALDDARALARLVADADAVLHCAGVVAAHTAADYERTNRAGTKRLVDAISARGADGPAFLLVSSLAAKGPSPGPEARPAHAPARPISAYGTSKLGAEAEARRLVAQNPVTIVRPPALYGPHDRGFLPLLKLVRRGVWPLLGPRDARMSMLYGPDCAALLLHLLTQPPTRGTVRLVEPADGPPHDVAALRTAMQHATGTKRLMDLRVPGVVLSGAAHATRLLTRLGRKPSMLNPDKARELRAWHWLADTTSLDGIAWSPRMPLTTGLRETAAWYAQEGWL